MATFKIPNENGLIRQLGVNDTWGELWATKNIDLHTNPGKIKLARPLKQVATATQLANDEIAAFVTRSTASQQNEVYALTEDSIFKDTAPFTSWSNVQSVSSATPVDAVMFKGQMVYNTNNNLSAFDLSSTTTADWWTARGNPSLTAPSSVPRVLEIARIGAERLVVTDGNEVHAYEGGISSGAVLSVTMELDESMYATCFKSGIRSGWVGTYTRSASQAYVYQWDVSSTNYTQAFPVGAKAVLAMEIVDDVPLIVTDRGEIKIFNNAGFTTVARFPFAGKATFTDQSTNPNNVNRPIHPKGIKRLGDVVYIYTNWRRADNDLNLDDRTPNGLWAFNLSTNSLTHLCSQDNASVFNARGACPVLVIDDAAARIFLGGIDYDGNEGIWIEDLDDTTANYGYFTTVEIQSDSVSDALEKAHLKSLMDDNDEVVIKYRTQNVLDYPITITDATWTGVGENTFTSTDSNMATVKTRYDAGHRDEIEVLQGQGAGRLAHITSLTENAGTYTVVVDEQIGVNGQTAIIRFDNWQKIPVSMTNADGELKSLGYAGEKATWHQLKVELKGKAGYPEIRQLISKTNNKEEI